MLKRKIKNIASFSRPSLMSDDFSSVKMMVVMLTTSLLITSTTLAFPADPLHAVYDAPVVQSTHQLFEEVKIYAIVPFCHE